MRGLRRTHNRLLTDMDDDTTVASLDGIGAYDHVSRACFLEELQQVRRGELSRAAKKLVASPLAPGTQETLNKLADPRRRPTRLFRPLREEDL